MLVSFTVVFSDVLLTGAVKFSQAILIWEPLMILLTATGSRSICSFNVMSLSVYLDVFR